MDELAKFKVQFIGFAGNHVRDLQRQLGEIRNDLANHTVVTEMHMSAHSLKGEAYAVGYKQIGDLAGMAEKYLRQLLDTKSDFPIEKFPAFAYVIAMIASAITKLEQTNEEPELKEIINTSKEQLGIDQYDDFISRG